LDREIANPLFNGLWQQWDERNRLFEDHLPDVVAIENLFGGKCLKTSMAELLIPLNLAWGQRSAISRCAPDNQRRLFWEE